MPRRVTIDNTLFAPLTEAFTVDPFPVWAQLTEGYPVAWHTEMRQWIISSHALASDVLRSPEFARSQEDVIGRPLPSSRPPSDFDLLVQHALLFVGAPKHRRLRRLMAPAFAQMIVPRIEKAIREAVASLFDRLSDRNEFDVHPDLADRIPVATVTRTLGLGSDHDDFLHRTLQVTLGRAANPTISAVERNALIEVIAEGLAFLKEEVTRRRETRGNGLIDLLLDPTVDGDALSDWDVIALLASLFAGDSAVDLHTYAILELLSSPAQYATLLADPTLFDDAVLEIVRHGAFFRTGVPRWAVRDIELGGQQIRRGESVLLALGAAWNDPAKWPQPRQFDLLRSQSGNLVFGAGPHFCIGLNLAKAQCKVMIEEFSARFPHARLAGTPIFDFSHYNARRIVSLRVRTAHE